MRFVPQLPGQFSDKNNKNSAKAQFMKSLEKGNKKGAGQASAEERYQDILNDKLEQTRNEAMKGAKYNFQLAGTDPAQCRQLSKSAQEVIQKIAEKKAKQAAKKQKKADIVAVQAKYFTGMQGGRIDKSGRIFDAHGQVVLEVDKKTGKIKNKMGNVVGNYDPNSPYSEHRICELIAKHSNQRGWYAGTAGHGVQQASGGIWGKSDSSAGNGSIWGTASGGSIWGSSASDDKNSGWW